MPCLSWTNLISTFTFHTCNLSMVMADFESYSSARSVELIASLLPHQPSDLTEGNEKERFLTDNSKVIVPCEPHLASRHHDMSGQPQSRFPDSQVKGRS